MKLLRLIFGLQRIYFKQTPLQILFFYALVFTGLWFFGTIGQQEVAANYSNIFANLASSAVTTAYIVAAYSLARTIIRTWLVSRYVNEYSASLIRVPSSEIVNSSVNLELDNIDRFENIATFGDAKVFLATFDFYQHTKSGDYLSKEVYYTVLEVKLKRRLPHILFDSKSAKRRQFRHQYLKAQQLSVQGTFDDVFDTYVPENYNIDSLSFVTPEVMEVLQGARSYDIELFGDKLFLYAPLLDKQDLQSFAAEGEAIAKSLDDNIDTYRDDRLVGEARKTDTTLFARTLLRSPFKNIIYGSITGVVTIGIIGWAVLAAPVDRSGILFNQISVLIYLLFATHLWRAAKIISDNNKAEESYRVLYQTNRGKPLKKTAG